MLYISTRETGVWWTGDTEQKTIRLRTKLLFLYHFEWAFIRHEIGKLKHSHTRVNKSLAVTLSLS